MANATRTTGREKLWRWQRGIVRALLLTGALAGMTLGTVAHAQIVARTPASSAGEVAAPAPTFKSFSAIAAAANGGADPTVTLPAHAADDILLLATIVRSNTATVATPAGWTQIGTPTVRSTVATYQFFWKRAASGAETNPLINRTGTTGDVYAAVIVYQGAFASGDPWEVKGAVVTGTADPSVITGITTLTANSLVVVAVAGEDNNNGSIITTGTNPAAYTEHYIESGTGTDGVITFSEFARTTTGATGNVSVNWNTAVPIGFGGIVLALRPTTSALTIAMPAGTVQNDVMVASVGFRSNSPGQNSTDILITPPGGWALAPVGRVDNLNSTSSALAVYWKTAGVSEAGPYTWTFTCTSTCIPLGFNAAAGGIVSFSGVDTTTPVDGGDGAPTASATTTPGTPPAFATTVANTMLVTSHAIPNANTWASSPPSGMTQAFQRTSGTEMIQVSSATQAAAGATGTKTATDLGGDAADFGNAHILALRPMLPVLNQSAYRLFDNANSTDVGTVLAAQDTAAVLGTTGGAFRLRMLLHVTNANIAISGQAFKLQFAARSGTCDSAFSGESYADVTAVSVIAYNNNATPADGNNLTANVNDPTHSGHTVRNQDYEELNNFDNSVAAINIGEDGKWDFALRDNGASASTAYCFRAVKDTGTVLNTYTVIPEISTAAGVTTPGSFNAFETSTAASSITGQIFTKLVSTNFSLDIVAILSGAQHSTFTDTVQVDLVTGAAGGLNCPGTPVTIAGTTQNVNLSNGRGTTGNSNVASAFPDVRVRVRYPVASPAVTSCSTDNFSIRPTAFTVTSTNATQTGSSGTPTIKTGVNFNLTAASVAGYNGTPGIDNTKVVGTPTAGAIGGSFGAAPVGTGTATGASFFYSEVGNFGLSADAVRDTAFTSVDQGPGDCVASSTSNTLSGWKYGCWVGSTAVPQTTGSSGFGRFIPDNFNVIYTTPPVFGTGCGTFTYVGAAFTYPTAMMTVTARNGTSNGLTNATTTNYAGAYVKLTNASLTPGTQAARYSRFDALGGGTTPALDLAGLPATAGDPAISTFTNGVGTLTFGSGTGLAFTRSTTTANAPFDADIALALNVIDSDGVVFNSNPASFGAASAGNGIAFSSGKPMRFGRLRLDNASGSSLLDLPLPLSTQYYDGSFFVTNTADSCTTLLGSDLRFGFLGTTPNLVACETAIIPGGTIYFVGGKASATASPTLTPAKLAKPGSGNDGAVDIAINLNGVAGNRCTAVGAAGPAATNANKPWLRGNWSGGTYTEDPTGRATFGIFKNADKFLYFREVY